MSRIQSFAYYGGKSSKINWLLPLLNPSHKTELFVDACCGSAAVALNWGNLYGEKSVIINDLHSEIYNFFKTMRDHGEELSKQLSLTPWCKEEFDNSLLVVEEDSDVEKARKFYVKITQGFGAKTTKDWKGAIWARSRTAKNRAQTTEEGLARLAKSLKRFGIENNDAIEVVEYYGSNKSNLIYVDPPYPKGARKTTGEYFNEPEDDWHIKLLEACVKAKASVAISSYSNALYEGSLRGWHTYEMATYNHFANQAVKVTDSNFKRTEVLFTNYSASGIISAFL